jgi:hypothetical protein
MDVIDVGLIGTSDDLVTRFSHLALNGVTPPHRKNPATQ